MLDDDDDDDDKTQSYHQALLNQEASHIISYPWSEIRYFKFILPAFKKKKVCTNAPLCPAIMISLFALSAAVRAARHSQSVCRAFLKSQCSSINPSVVRLSLRRRYTRNALWDSGDESLRDLRRQLN